MKRSSALLTISAIPAGIFTYFVLAPKITETVLMTEINAQSPAPWTSMDQAMWLVMGPKITEMYWVHGLPFNLAAWLLLTKLLASALSALWQSPSEPEAFRFGRPPKAYTGAVEQLQMHQPHVLDTIAKHRKR